MLKKLFFYVTMSFFMITIVPNAIAKNNQNIEKLSQKSPFSKFVKLIEESDRAVVYGENASLFTSYNGPQVVTDITDDIQRKRYGILQLSSSLNVYLDYISDPMGGTYEFINVKNNQVVGQIADPYNMTESLYINGAGELYTYASPAGICWGKTTYKYELQNNILVEVQQPFYSINTYSVISKDIDLLKAPQSDSQKVASLQAGMGTNIIGVSYDKNNDSLWFLVKTPLGLIGWANSLKDDVMVFNITQCN